jgi:hypothetical protein
MGIPPRLRNQEGTYSLVDGVPFAMPIGTRNSTALMAAFTIDADKSAAYMPGPDLHPLRIWNKGILLVTVIDYVETDIGKYIEFSIGIACTRGKKRAPRMLPLLFRNHYGMGQYVMDLPVSTEISVKGGKGIWGMPKHQASLDFIVEDDLISSQYDLDGELAVRIDIQPPGRKLFPVTMNSANYCEFRGIMWKSFVHFAGKPSLAMLKGAKATLTVGDNPRVAWMKDIGVSDTPIMTAYYPEFSGVLDDYVESWFLRTDQMPTEPYEGLDAVADLDLSEEWPPPPNRNA